MISARSNTYCVYIARKMSRKVPEIDLHVDGEGHPIRRFRQEVGRGSLSNIRPKCPVALIPQSGIKTNLLKLALSLGDNEIGCVDTRPQSGFDAFSDLMASKPGA